MLKMSQLVAQSGISKSTILYYLKEGLLPPPQKPKPNVHLYEEKTLKILEFIKYFQEHLGYSISQIKEILKDQKIDFDNDSETVLGYLQAMQTPADHNRIEALRQQAEAMGADPILFETYAHCAKQLAALEYEMGAKILKNQTRNENNRLQKLIFDIILTYKPYIFNQATLDEHKRRLKIATDSDTKEA